MRTALTISSIALVLGVFDLPIGYYTFLRILVFATCLLFVYLEHNTSHNNWIIAFSIIAILFNPLFPVYLGDKSYWFLIDLIVAILFIIKSFNLNKPNDLR